MSSPQDLDNIMSYGPQDHYADEKKELLELSKETFFTFGKCDFNTLQSDPSKLLPLVLLNNIRQYVSHSTQTIIIDNQLHYLTVFVLKLPLVQACTESDKSLLTRAQRFEGVHDFGLGPAVSEDRCKIIYRCDVSRRGILFREQEISYLTFMPAVGGCYLETKGAIIQIKDIRAEQPPEGYFSRSNHSRTPGLELKVHYRCFSGPLIDKMKGNDILLPNYSLSRPYCLKLEVKYGMGLGVGPLSVLEVCGLEVEMHEIVKYLDCNSVSGPRVLWAARAKSCKRDFKISYSFRALLKGELLSLDLPPSVLDCLIPPLGPTFLSSSFKRNYYLKFKLQVRYMLTLVELVLIKSVLMLHCEQTDSAVCKSLLPYHYMIYLEKLSEPWSSIKDTGRAPLKRFRKTGLSYLRHQTESFLVSNALLALTKVEFTDNHLTEAEKEGFPNYASSVEIPPEEDLALVSRDKDFKINFQVIKLSDSLKVNRGSHYVILCIHTEGTKIPIELPVHGVCYSEDYLWLLSYPIVEDSHLYGSIHPHLICLIPKYQGLTMSGAFVLYPNRNLRDSFSFVFEHHSKRNGWFFSRWLNGTQHGVSIKKVTFKIKRVSSWLDARGRPCESQRTQLLLERDCNEKPKLSGTVVKQKNRHGYYYTLPGELYDVNLPPLKPTIFTNSYSRVHWLIVTLGLYMNDVKDSIEWTAEFPVLIAGEE